MNAVELLPVFKFAELEFQRFKNLETWYLAQIGHLVELGVNAVELLPVFEYDELEFQRSKNPRDHMVNIWGYSHASFFAPMSRFGSGGAGPAAAARQLKELVCALHGAGIEVILDVVYNHTVEGARVRLPGTASRLQLKFIPTL